MISIEKAYKLRQLIEDAVKSLTDEDALEGIELFPQWSGYSITYTTGDRVRYGGVLYKVLQDHTSQVGWTPDSAPSLFAVVLIPDPDVVPEWVQPDSTNPYMKGDKVAHNGQTWISTVDNNVWEPGVYGWEVVE